MAAGDPYRRIAGAVLRRALLDARGGNGHAAEARRWLRSSAWALEILEALDGAGVDRRALSEWIEELPAVEQPALM